MFKRFPHIGTILISTETDEPIPTVNDVSIEIKGRYEPSSQSKSLDYSAKFYCSTNAFEPFEADGQRFIFNNKQFKIVQLHNFQTHCEIWLE